MNKFDDCRCRPEDNYFVRSCKIHGILQEAEGNHNINIQGNYEWKPEYLPLYRGLVKKKETDILTKDERALLQWLSYSLANWALRI